MCVYTYIVYIQALGGEILNVLTMLGDEEGAVEEKVSSSRRRFRRSRRSRRSSRSSRSGSRKSSKRSSSRRSRSRW